jgi:hypothetical protein
MFSNLLELTGSAAQPMLEKLVTINAIIVDLMSMLLLNDRAYSHDFIEASPRGYPVMNSGNKRVRI